MKDVILVAKKVHRTMIGGQAVIEGVMMRGVDKTALAVRKPDGSISLDVWPTLSARGRFSPLRLPIRIFPAFDDHLVDSSQFLQSHVN